ncbi:hypothetical protein [Vibrio breoganii]|uniref:hypothetical protein n=1 Tax=Vibrio breoganii TaxID=553239 RepID=UPI001F114281|nr:hypothetical protein [Vibrio breoganii]
MADTTAISSKAKGRALTKVSSQVLISIDVSAMPTLFTAVLNAIPDSITNAIIKPMDMLRTFSLELGKRRSASLVSSAINAKPKGITVTAAVRKARIH